MGCSKLEITVRSLKEPSKVGKNREKFEKPFEVGKNQLKLKRTLERFCCWKDKSQLIKFQYRTMSQRFSISG